MSHFALFTELKLRGECMYREGDYVLDHMGYVGYISEIKGDETYYVVFPKLGRGRVGIRSRYELTPAPIELHKEDILTMQRLAFDSVDKDWWNELVSKLPIKGEV